MATGLSSHFKSLADETTKEAGFSGSSFLPMKKLPERFSISKDHKFALAIPKIQFKSSTARISKDETQIRIKERDDSRKRRAKV